MLGDCLGFFPINSNKTSTWKSPGPWEVPDFRTSSPVTKKWPLWVRHRDVGVGWKVYVNFIGNTEYAHRKKKGIPKMMVGTCISPSKHSYSNFGGATCDPISMGFFTTQKKTPDFCWGDPTLQLWNVATFSAIDMTALVQVVCLQLLDIYPPATVGLSLPSWECHPCTLALPTALMVLL